MTAYDWLMALGLVAILGFVARAFWQADKLDSLDQPDNTPPGA